MLTILVPLIKALLSGLRKMTIISLITFLLHYVSIPNFSTSTLFWTTKIKVLTEEHPTAAHSNPALIRAVKMYGKL